MERMSADAFKKRARRQKSNAMGPRGSRWVGTCGHRGWQPDPPDKCPRCGKRISISDYRRGTLREWTEWENRQK